MSKEYFEEYQELLRKAAMDKTKLIEVKTKGTDRIQSYARDMPPELADGQSWWFDILVWGVEDPASPELVVTAILGIYATEGIMSRFLALAEVLHDREREADYRALSSSDSRLRDAFTSLDTSKMEAENE